MIPGSGSNRRPDPIVWFAGGPGDSAVNMIDRVKPLLGSASDRDLVFIEQRGTGASNLACPAFAGLDDITTLRRQVTSCLQSLNADLPFYSTAAFADDADQVLAALDYPTVNLTGISYGTTAEQVFLQRHPSRVRTMTLLSGTLLTVPVFERMPRNAQLALDGVLAECASNGPCQRAFPHLRAEWAALWASLSRQPLVVPSERSPTRERLVLDSDWFAGKFHQLLMTASSQVAVPVVVHTLATATDRVGALLELSKALPDNQSAAADDSTQVLPFATQCHEQWGRRDPDRLMGTDSFEYHSDLAAARWWQYVCGLMPAPQPSGPTGELANPKAAVLTLNGTVDPQDPPSNMAGGRSLWPSGAVLEVPGQGHDIDDRSGACVAPIIQSFIERGTPRGVDTSCLEQLRSRSFPVDVQALTTG